MLHVLRTGTIAAMIAVLSATVAGECAAHPHIVIEAEVALEVRAGALVEVRQRWTFDEAYRITTYEEFDKNRNGILDPEEMRAFQALALATMGRFNSFTTIEAGNAKAQTQQVVFTALDMKAPRPVIEFKLVLVEPLAVSPSVVIQIYDPTFYSAFRISRESQLSVSADAGLTCAASLTAPPKDGAQLKAYRAFAVVFGPVAARSVKPQAITLACGALEKAAAVAADNTPAVDIKGR